jgi:hypothetical protein
MLWPKRSTWGWTSPLRRPGSRRTRWGVPVDVALALSVDEPDADAV